LGIKYEVFKKLELAPKIKLLKINAPEIARKTKPGQFVILRIDEKGERIPLTLVEWEPKKGTITLACMHTHSIHRYLLRKKRMQQRKKS